MYSIKKEPFGFRLIFKNKVDKNELTKWIDESKKLLERKRNNFGVLVDMRHLQPLSQEDSALMQEGQKLYRENGLERSAVILDSAVLTLQFRKIAKDSGIHATEKYINAKKESNWEEKALQWIESGVNPD